MIDAAGGRNILDNFETSWGRTSWETVAERNPEFLVLIDYQNGSGHLELLDFLKAHPAMGETDAVKNERFVAPRYAEPTPGPANIEAIRKILAAMVMATDPGHLIPAGVPLARRLMIAAGITVLLDGSLLASVALGSAWLPSADVAAILVEAVIGPAAGALGFEATEGPISRIVLELRAPRAILAAIVGAGLAVVGMLLQSTTRNDLADPFLFGLSSGAAAGAVFVITVSGDVLGIWTLPVAAFVGGLASAASVLLLVARAGIGGPERLILAGLAVSFLLAALTNFLIFSSDQGAAHSVFFWSLGGLGLARWDNLGFATGGLFVIMATALVLRHALDALLAGDDAAESLGVSPRRTRVIVFIAAAFATASFVALSGVIGFVGLMVPHLGRALVGPLHGPLTLICAGIGAILMLLGDIAARTLLAPQELPLGNVIGAVGAVFVVVLVVRRA
ncbi:MAG: iron chelate uptake ABC transporter family permease subunit [Pseudomonadota bacterium]